MMQKKCFFLDLKFFLQKCLKNKKGDEKKKIDPGGNQKFSGKRFFWKIDHHAISSPQSVSSFLLKEVQLNRESPFTRAIFWIVIWCSKHFESAAKGDRKAQMDIVLTSHPLVPSLILGLPKNFSLDVAEIYRRHCFEL